MNLMNGDCLEKLKGIPDNSVDAIVTDPPYGLSKEPNISDVLSHWMNGDCYQHKHSGFMGKEWDSFVPCPQIWKECLRVLKPGGHLLSFFGTRTYDLGVIALRLAGFEIRDQISWVYSQGFPKGQDVSRSIDKKLGGSPVVVGRRKHSTLKDSNKLEESAGAAHGSNKWQREWNITEPETDLAKAYYGWKTQLKPAIEPIVVARKPLSEKTVADNIIKWGTGALNIEDCRIPVSKEQDASQLRTMKRNQRDADDGWGMTKSRSQDNVPVISEQGRYPSNFIHDGSQMVLDFFPDAKGQQGDLKQQNSPKANHGIYGQFGDTLEHKKRNDVTASASRFFYCAKASRSERNAGVGCSDVSAVKNNATMREIEKQDWSKRNGNHHPTVKPKKLITYLITLVTPPCSTGVSSESPVVLDPFMGSGTTGVCSKELGYRFIGIEKNEEYFEIAQKRIEFSVNENFHEEKRNA